tara:strand:+ start:1993 stop:2181 length:189 start_codon:yes stop_codon:yes gene_type:complete
MKTYEVTIRATVTKTYEVRAINEDSAEDLANDMFDVSYERGIPDKYAQDTIEIREAEDDEDY